MEQQSLEFAIASLSSPSLELMQTLQQLIVKTSDGTSPLFLVYGALVANFGADKKSEMVPFLTKWIPKDGLGNSEILVNLLHALGNTRSSQAVEYIIRYTQHDDRAVKAAAVSSLCFFIHEPVVQQELSSILERNSSDKDALVGGIIEALQEGYSYNQDVSLNLELIEHLVNVTVGLRNAHLRNELILFLERVGTSDTLRMAQRLSEIRQRRSASTNTNNWSNPSNVQFLPQRKEGWMSKIIQIVVPTCGPSVWVQTQLIVTNSIYSVLLECLLVDTIVISKYWRRVLYMSIYLVKLKMLLLCSEI